MTSPKLKKSVQHTHDMTQIEGGHVDDRVGAVPGPDSVNRHVSGPLLSVVFLTRPKKYGFVTCFGYVMLVLT